MAKQDKPRRVTVLFSAKDLSTIAQLSAEMGKERGGYTVSTSDAVRRIIHEWREHRGQ